MKTIITQSSFCSVLKFFILANSLCGKIILIENEKKKLRYRMKFIIRRNCKLQFRKCQLVLLIGKNYSQPMLSSRLKKTIGSHIR